MRGLILEDSSTTLSVGDLVRFEGAPHIANVESAYFGQQGIVAKVIALPAAGVVYVTVCLFSGKIISHWPAHRFTLVSRKKSESTT